LVRVSAVNLHKPAVTAHSDDAREPAAAAAAAAAAEMMTAVQRFKQDISTPAVSAHAVVLMMQIALTTHAQTVSQNSLPGQATWCAGGWQD
jgi:hypothetical protein